MSKWSDPDELIKDAAFELGTTNDAAKSAAHSLLAIAKMMEQMHVCGHGTRGYCPHCLSGMRDGQAPA